MTLLVVGTIGALLVWTIGVVIHWLCPHNDLKWDDGQLWCTGCGRDM
jgi:hypothetical protein